LFFLAGYEQINDITPNTSYNTYSDPNPTWITGDFSTATYWNSTTQSLQPLTIYDPLTPLHTVQDCNYPDGKCVTKQAHDAFAGNVIPKARIDQVAANILGYLSYLSPNVNPGAGYAPWTNNYQNLQVENDHWRNIVVKIDYKRMKRTHSRFTGLIRPARSLPLGCGRSQIGSSQWNGQGTAPAAQPTSLSGRASSNRTSC